MRFSAFCEYTNDEEGHRFAEYGICCKTGSTDVKIRGITLYNRRFYNAEVQRRIVR